MMVERTASERDGSLGCTGWGEHDGGAAPSGGPSQYVLDVILTGGGSRRCLVVVVIVTAKWLPRLTCVVG